MVTPGRYGKHATGQFREILHWHRNNNGMTWVGQPSGPRDCCWGETGITRTLGWTPGCIAVASRLGPQHPGESGRNRDRQCRIPSRSQSLHRSLTVPLKLLYFAAGRRNETSDSLRADTCIIAGTTKYVNLRTDPYCHDEALRPTKCVVGLPARLPHPGAGS
jgi:hypothetical protein